MKKVGILNYQYSDRNYGAVLQAAALHWYIDKKINITSEHINFIPDSFYPSFNLKIKVFLGDILRRYGLKRPLLNHYIFKNPSVFEDFRCQWIPRTDKTFKNIDELAKYKFDYTHVIVGSDQVWRPSYTENAASIFFLSFVKPEVKRISYAASFGNDYWELSKSDPLTKEIKKEIDLFDSISVREDSGLNICREIFEVDDAHHVLDPTLLCGREFFDKILDDKLESINNNIVHYKLELDDKFSNLLESLSKKNKLTIANIYYRKEKNNYYYLSVEDWVNEIKCSQLVVTDSFHCICLAIIYEKDFLYYPNDDRGLSRIQSLFTALNINGRIYNDNKIAPEVYFNSLDKINYADVNERLEELRMFSSNFINNALSKGQ